MPDIPDYAEVQSIAYMTAFLVQKGWTCDIYTNAKIWKKKGKIRKVESCSYDAPYEMIETDEFDIDEAFNEEEE